MDTPPSPPLPSKSQPPTQPSHQTAESASIPLNSPLRTHPKRGLPPTFASTYPHGHISGYPRTAEQQAAFDVRKAEILRTMGSKDIEKAYEDVVRKIREELDESERRGREGMDVAMPGCLPTTIALRISLNYKGEFYDSARAIFSAAYWEARFEKPLKM
ncbi:MAG: hypothetical protein ASARMPREDX12_000886 [Alectoria sarmentosa]|nr:MAG: hypothetical protein ASARMPREDX12_000886 [Alectoria sarmentosa]